jgi:hypothetical protein
LLTAALLAAGMAGRTAGSLAQFFQWPLDTTHYALDALREHPPPGIRVHTNHDGHASLRPDHQMLVATPPAPVPAPPPVADSDPVIDEPVFNLTPALAQRLLNIFEYPDERLPDVDRDALIGASIITDSGTLTTDSTYSLLWYTKQHF